MGSFSIKCLEIENLLKLQFVPELTVYIQQYSTPFKICLWANHKCKLLRGVLKYWNFHFSVTYYNFTWYNKQSDVGLTSSIHMILGPLNKIRALP